MPNSKIDPSKEFTEELWVVSVLNTGSNDKLVGHIQLGGHAMIVIEAIQQDPKSINKRIVVRQYDILAVSTEEQNNLINVTGYITTVRCFKEYNYTRDYQQYASKSYYVTPINAKKIIKSIKADKTICEAASRGECEYPKYQYVGADHPLSQTGMGDNCAGWCASKLKEGELDVTTFLSKPKGLTGCSVL